MENLNNEAQPASGKFSPKRLAGSVMQWVEKTAGRPLKTKDKVIGIILIVAFLFVFYVVLDANKYPAMVHIIEGRGSVGVNPTAEAIDFGDLSRGTGAVRRVDLKNGTFMPMYVMVFKMGSIRDLVKIDRNFFKLKAGENTKIEFEIYIPASAEVGHDYRGRVFLFKVPTFWL